MQLIAMGDRPALAKFGPAHQQGIARPFSLVFGHVVSIAMVSGLTAASYMPSADESMRLSP
jgi:hypothetical protein